MIGNAYQAIASLIFFLNIAHKFLTYGLNLQEETQWMAWKKFLSFEK